MGLDWPASRILSAKAFELFPSEKDAQATHRALAKKWHPDRHTGQAQVEANAVLSHINAQLAKARESWAKGETADVLNIRMSDGSAKTFEYIAVKPTELGEVYVCPRHIIYACERQYDDLVKRALLTSKEFKFPSTELEQKVRKHLPRNIHAIGNKDRSYTILARDGDYVRAVDLLDHGPIAPEHVAWILSRAYNLASWMTYSRLTHLDISPESFFIELETHRGALYGGWFYSGYGEGPSLVKPIAAPARTSHLAKAAGTRAHMSMIRLMGRRLLGASSFGALKARKDVPEPMKRFLLTAGTDNAFKEEAEWKEVLRKSFGPPKFVKHSLSAAEIYKR